MDTVTGSLVGIGRTGYREGRNEVAHIWRPIAAFDLLRSSSRIIRARSKAPLGTRLTQPSLERGALFIGQ